jgi:hypothetical protein
MFNGGGRLNETALINHPSLMAINRGGRLTETASINPLTEAAVVMQPPLLIRD